jgi:hypothetical protein
MLVEHKVIDAKTLAAIRYKEPVPSA